MNKSKRNTVIVFIVAAIFLVVAILTFLKASKFSRLGVSADATITKILSYTSGDDLEHEVTVTFTTEEGEEISGILDSYSSSFYEGKVIPIKYLRDDPHEFAYAKGSYVLPVILGIAGVALIGFGVFSLLRGNDEDGEADFKGRSDDSQKDNW